MKRIYAALCILGFVVPYAFFIPFLFENGLNLELFARQMFANKIASFFSADVLVSSIVLWTFIYFETHKHTIRNWWLAILANLTGGVSLAMPLFLLLRETERETEA